MFLTGRKDCVAAAPASRMLSLRLGAGPGAGLDLGTDAIGVVEARGGTLSI